MKTIVGLFDTYSQAEATVRDLEAAGFGRDRVSLIANRDARSARSGAAATTTDKTDVAEGAGTGAMIGGVTGAAAGLIAGLAGLAIPGIGPVLAAGPLVATLVGAGVGAAAGGLVGALITAGVPHEHAEYYAEGIRRGGSLVVVSASDEDAERVMDIMNRHTPVDIEERAEAWRQAGFTVATPTTRANTGVSAGTGVGAAAGRSERLEGEQHIPVVEEELRVGKREVDRGGVRVETRVQERPVEEQVNLREERVRVERRPVDRPAEAGDIGRAFVEGTMEVTERVEEPVVQKEARVVEEVVVGKEATERTETVRDTVRRTDVEIQPVDVESGAVSAVNFVDDEADFRSNFQQSNPGTEYTFEQARPAYRFGYELGGDRSRGRGDWSAVEPDARRRWEERNPGTWDRFKNAARYAYDRARSKVS